MSNTKSRTVFITGTTQGLNAEIANEFIQQNDICIILTQQKTESPNFVLNIFSNHQKENKALTFNNIKNTLEWIKDEYGRLDVFVCNAFESQVIDDFESFEETTFNQAIETNSWPIVGISQEIKSVFGKCPKYILGLSLGENTEKHVYDSACKSLNEVMVKYLNYHFYTEEVHFNIIKTPINEDAKPKQLQEVAKVVYIFTSGLMDAIRGQSILVDRNFR